MAAATSSSTPASRLPPATANAPSSHQLTLSSPQPGTTQVIVPAADAALLHAPIPHAKGPDASGIYLIPCTTNVTFAFTISGVDFAIDPRDIILDEIDATEPEGWCQSGIAAAVSTADLDPLWLVGDVFLKNVSGPAIASVPAKA